MTSRLQELNYLSPLNRITAKETFFRGRVIQIKTFPKRCLDFEFSKTLNFLESLRRINFYLNTLSKNKG